MTLNDIRKRSGLLVIVIGLGMFGFIFMDVFSGGPSLFQGGQNVLLKIDNQELTITEFEEELQTNINMKFVSSLGTVNITEAQRISERDLLWDQKMKEILLEEKFDQSGISVSGLESWDLVSGEITGNQAPLFGYFFRDQTEEGEWVQYTPDLVEEWISWGSDNPQWSRYLFFEQNITRDRGFTKYYTAIKKGLYATTQDARVYYNNQTQSISGKYIYIPCNNNLDEFIPSEGDINKYYKKNKIDFPNTPNREISYFIFPLIASDSDKITILKEMEALIPDKMVFNKRLNKEEQELGFMNIDKENIEQFVKQNGDGLYELIVLSREDFIQISQKRTIKNNIVEPYIENETCRMGRIIESNEDSVSIVYLEREIYASDQTLNDIYSEVYDFMDDNKKINDIKEVSKQINKQARTVNLEDMDQSVPGLGISRQIVKWAFNEETNLNEPQFFDLQDKYIVAMVSKISENETKLIEEVYDDIRVLLQTKNKGKKLIHDINNSNSQTISDLAKEFNTEVKNINQLRLNADIFGDEGYNPAAVGSFFGCQPGEISPAFMGENGVFVFYKDSDGSINYPPDFNRYQSLIERTQQATADLILIDVLKNEKDITDNRFTFY